MTARERIEEMTEENVIIFDNPSYDTAFVGLSNDNRAIYDYDLMIDYLINNDKMTYQEAAEFIEYNTLNAYYSEYQPIIMFK